LPKTRYEIPLTETQERILSALSEYGPLGTGKLEQYTGLDNETILINCRELIKQDLILDKENQKGKYRLVNKSKIPTFLSFKARNRSFVTDIINDIFSPSQQEQQDLLEEFSNKIGIFILYVLIESLRPDGPSWTAKAVDKSKGNDPRMKNLDLLRKTWLIDTIDPNFIFEQFNKYFNNQQPQPQNYQDFIKKFESVFPDIYKMIEEKLQEYTKSMIKIYKIIGIEEIRIK
jgi:hypothetical protein